MNEQTSLSLHELMEQERKRLNDRRSELQKQLKELQGEIEKVDNEIAAIDTYKAAKEGKTPQTQKRTRRSGVRDTILSTIKQSQEGYTRAELIEQMEAHDKSAQQSISNALSSLKKQGKVTQQNGRYVSM